MSAPETSHSNTRAPHSIFDFSIPPVILFGRKPPFTLENYCYRGDLRTPNEIFNQGLSARGGDLDLYRHAMPVGEAYNAKSAFVSTSTNKDIASLFPIEDKYNMKSRYVYEIETPSGAIDVKKHALEPALKSGKLHPEDYAIHLRENEVAVPRRIDPRQIKSATLFQPSHQPEGIPRETHLVYQNSNFNPKSARIWTTAKWAGRGLTAFAVLADSHSLLESWNESPWDYIKHKRDFAPFKREAASIAGGWGGALAFGQYGAYVGALGGGPIGAAIGGFVAGGLGYYAGSEWARSLYDWSQNFARENDALSILDFFIPPAEAQTFSTASASDYPPRTKNTFFEPANITPVTSLQAIDLEYSPEPFTPKDSFTGFLECTDTSPNSNALTNAYVYYSGDTSSIGMRQYIAKDWGTFANKFNFHTPIFDHENLATLDNPNQFASSYAAITSHNRALLNSFMEKHQKLALYQENPTSYLSELSEFYRQASEKTYPSPLNPMTQLSPLFRQQHVKLELELGRNPLPENFTTDLSELKGVIPGSALENPELIKLVSQDPQLRSNLSHASSLLKAPRDTNSSTKPLLTQQELNMASAGFQGLQTAGQILDCKELSAVGAGGMAAVMGYMAAQAFSAGGALNYFGGTGLALSAICMVASIFIKKKPGKDYAQENNLALRFLMNTLLPYQDRIFSAVVGGTEINIGMITRFAKSVFHRLNLLEEGFSLRQQGMEERLSALFKRMHEDMGTLETLILNQSAQIQMDPLKKIMKRLDDYRKSIRSSNNMPDEEFLECAETLSLWIQELTLNSSLNGKLLAESSTEKQVTHLEKDSDPSKLLQYLQALTGPKENPLPHFSSWKNTVMHYIFLRRWHFTNEYDLDGAQITEILTDAKNYAKSMEKLISKEMIRKLYSNYMSSINKANEKAKETLKTYLTSMSAFYLPEIFAKDLSHEYQWPSASMMTSENLWKLMPGSKEQPKRYASDIWGDQAKAPEGQGAESLTIRKEDMSIELPIVLANASQLGWAQEKFLYEGKLTPGHHHMIPYGSGWRYHWRCAFETGLYEFHTECKLSVDGREYGAFQTARAAYTLEARIEDYFSHTKAEEGAIIAATGSFGLFNLRKSQVGSAPYRYLAEDWKNHTAHIKRTSFEAKEADKAAEKATEMFKTEMQEKRRNCAHILSGENLAKLGIALDARTQAYHGEYLEALKEMQLAYLQLKTLLRLYGSEDEIKALDLLSCYSAQAAFSAFTDTLENLEKKFPEPFNDFDKVAAAKRMMLEFVDTHDCFILFQIEFLCSELEKLRNFVVKAKEERSPNTLATQDKEVTDETRKRLLEESRRAHALKQVQNLLFKGMEYIMSDPATIRVAPEALQALRERLDTMVEEYAIGRIAILPAPEELPELTFGAKP
jgi:hypothetical protein